MDGYLAHYDGDKLGSLYVRVSSADFEPLAEAMLAKFGKPTKRDRAPLQNLMGAKYMNETFIWRSSGRTMTLTKYAGSLEESSVMLAADAFIARRLSERAGKPDDL